MKSVITGVIPMRFPSPAARAAHAEPPMNSRRFKFGSPPIRRSRFYNSHAAQCRSEMPDSCAVVYVSDECHVSVREDTIAAFGKSGVAQGCHGRDARSLVALA